jgi:hypothetical protein
MIRQIEYRGDVKETGVSRLSKHMIPRRELSASVQSIIGAKDIFLAID